MKREGEGRNKSYEYSNLTNKQTNTEKERKSQFLTLKSDDKTRQSMNNRMRCIQI